MGNSRLIDHISNELDNVGGKVPAVSGVAGMTKGVLEKANFALQVKRLSANIALDLPYAIFGRSFITSGYTEVLTVPSGLTLSLKFGIIQNLTDTIANYAKVQFVYVQTVGGATDTIEITSKAAASYPSMLEALTSDVFSITKVRMSISPPTSVSQFATPFSVVNKSIFGKRDENEINIDSYKDPRQFQSGIIDIGLAANIDKETAFVGEMIQEVNITVVNSFSVSRIKKFNRNVLVG